MYTIIKLRITMIPTATTTITYGAYGSVVEDRGAMRSIMTDNAYWAVR